MIKNFSKLHEFLINSETQFKKDEFKIFFQNYLFFHFTSNTFLKEDDKHKIDTNLEESKIIMIDENGNKNEQFLIICFEKTLIIVEQPLISSFLQYIFSNKSNQNIKDQTLPNQSSSISYLQFLFSINPNIPICFLSRKQMLIQIKFELKDREIEPDSTFLEEVKSLSFGLQINQPKNSICQLWSSLTPCISGYLIKKSYLQHSIYKSRIDQATLEMDSDPEIISENEYVELRTIGAGSLFVCSLIYLITREKLLVIKKENSLDSEIPKLVERETENYKRFYNPFLPKYYGKVKDKDYIVIEFINGQTLDNIDRIELTCNDILTIIFELMIIIEYFYNDKFIYRDLKPNNIMIDERKTAVLIDFDRLIVNDDSNLAMTDDLISPFKAPETITNRKYSYKSDIYSLGKVIEYILNKTKFRINQDKISDQQDILSILKEVIQKCTNENPENRPFISEIIQDFLIKFQSKNLFTIYKAYIEFLHKKLYKLGEKLFVIGNIYYNGQHVEKNISKAIHYYSLAADQNYSGAQYNLGIIYQEGKYVTLNIEKAIHYFSLAADQNHPDAQYNLGVIYFEGKYVTLNIEKAIHYFSLAADQNHPDAQYNLGVIYFEHQYFQRNINKSIYYFSLAADLNCSDSQYILGKIYYNGKYVTRDINKSIYYFSLAANQNNSDAQLYLGILYYEGKYVKSNINKSIHYFTLAANQNSPDAQYNLGNIYYEGKYIKRDINKSIHYYTLAANQNDPEAQLNLGYIYDEGLYVTRDTRKAIYYYSLSANQNDSIAQYNLGFIYEGGRYVKRDINKAIHYYKLSANQNNPSAQFKLGILYLQNEFIKRDIEKSIYYFSLAASQFDPDSLYGLGIIYDEGIYVPRDINKAIHYFTLAANQNYPDAQFNLGIIYYTGKGVPKDIKKGRYYIMIASKNGNKDANFAHGFLFHEGKAVERNIEEAVHFYKEASSFNNNYAKNNLGIIYKHGYGDKIKQNIGNAIVYFEEAIHQKNDYLSMYNLAHIYMYDETIKHDLSKMIELLIKSSDSLIYSVYLLCLVLIKQNDFNIEKVEKAIEERQDISNELSTQIYQEITENDLYDKSSFEYLYELFRNIDLLYDISLNSVPLSDVQNDENIISQKYPKAKDISSMFYDGFGQDLF